LHLLDPAELVHHVDAAGQLPVAIHIFGAIGAHTGLRVVGHALRHGVGPDAVAYVDVHVILILLIIHHVVAERGGVRAGVAQAGVAEAADEGVGRVLIVEQAEQVGRLAVVAIV